MRTDPFEALSARIVKMTGSKICIALSLPTLAITMLPVLVILLREDVTMANSLSWMNSRIFITLDPSTTTFARLTITIFMDWKSIPIAFKHSPIDHNPIFPSLYHHFPMDIGAIMMMNVSQDCVPVPTSTVLLQIVRVRLLCCASRGLLAVWTINAPAAGAYWKNAHYQMAKSQKDRLVLNMMTVILENAPPVLVFPNFMMDPFVAKIGNVRERVLALCPLSHS